MELGAWRDAVSYGAYLQPIHLQVANTKPKPTSSSPSKESPSQLVQNSLQSGEKTVEVSSKGTPSIPTPVEAPSAVQMAQNTPKIPHDTMETLILPPFGSEILNQGEQMALNVGGPVWAMDWLPSKPKANSAAVAAALAPKKQKKPRRASKTALKKAVLGKENNHSESVEATTVASTEAEEAKLEWKFLALATHPPCQMEDGKVVKVTPPDHYYDVPESGRNLIQIWAVPVQQPKTEPVIYKGNSVKRILVKPRLVYAVDHDCGVVWDLQWCPLVKKFPKTNRRQDLLGILAACFGDGTVRVLEIPRIDEDRLQVAVGEEAVVEKNVAIVVAKLPRIIQLSVQWSPHSWNLLLSGGSDGSVSMWNIKSAVSETDSLKSDRPEPEPIEPQRRFQDADTIGKQEAFDWGCGWVAIRAVAWSPFDEHLFATTGNDSVFKVWDVREPRVCLRSHRIRSTWGLALQWMDQTSIQISGDQGSIYMYDILSGSYQKLHFHPQIDSPVWDLQFGRRGPVPLLVSSCTSGSIRAAPAKKLYRAPQSCVEICRLSGEKESSVEKPYKSLTLSLEKHSVLGSVDAGSLNTREFCERDAALHRLRLSSNTAGDYPCFLAAGGHAGLVILLEMQVTLDTLIPTFFLPPSKKIGRPKKMAVAPVDDHDVLRTGSPVETEGVPIPIPVEAVSVGRKVRTLGSFAKAKGMHTALRKYKKKSVGKGKAKVGSLAKINRSDPHKAFIQEDEEIEVEDSIEDEEEAEFEEEDDEEDESDLSLMGESSDDNCISVSDDSIEEEESASPTTNPEEARLMKEYQLDLSEEDAYLLALQMSKFDDVAPAPQLETETKADVPISTTAIATPEEPPNNAAVTQKDNTKTKPKTKTKVRAATKNVAKVTTTTKAAKAKATVGKKRARPSIAGTETIVNQEAAKVGDAAEAVEVNDDKPPGDEIECKAPTPSPVQVAEKEKRVTVAAPKRTKKPQLKKTPARKSTPKSKKDSPMLLEAINQAMALQAYEFQLGMSEEDALKEALRLSEMGDTTRRSSRAKHPVTHSTSVSLSAAQPTPTQPKQKTPSTPRVKGASQKKQKKKKLKKLEMKKDTDTGDEDPQGQRPQTPRRLEFSPLNGSEGGNEAEVPVASIDSETSGNPAVLKTDSAPSGEASPKKSAQMKPSRKKSAAKESVKKPSPKSRAEAVEEVEQKQPAKSLSSAHKTPKKTSDEVKVPVSAGVAADPPETPKGKKPLKRSRSTGGKAAAGSKAVKKRKKTTTSPRGGRQRSGAVQGDVMSEEDAFLLALKMSEIEY